MKILHYSDQNSSDFLNLYKEGDVLITTGDLSLFDYSGLELISNKKPAFGVYGNHDTGTYLEELGITNLHNKVVDYKGLKWGGFQGSPKYKPSGIMYTEEEAKSWANSFPYVDILLLHASPQGLLDDPSDPVHTGSTAIKKYVLEKHPRYIFCGHQYSNAEMQIENTQIFRTFGARLITV